MEKLRVSDIQNKILSDIIVYMKYAKYIPQKKRRETWHELVTRNKDMHIKKYPHLKNEIEEVYKLVYDKKILPSMRSLQFAGKPIKISPNRIYNCSYLPIDSVEAFQEIMFLLLGGSGVGYSVQRHHVKKLPTIKQPSKPKRYLIGDSIEGWADSIKVLMNAYFNGTHLPKFDFSDIRPKGAALITSGGKAPGPQPLKDCLHNIQKVLDNIKIGEKIKPIEVHDIICYIADAVLSGGIRRAACISLFSLDDEDMLSCKFGNWWELNPQRARANNSVVLLRHRIKKEDFFKLWKKIELSKSGEPGFILLNDRENGINPCVEANLRAFSFCNLVDINSSTIIDQEDFNNRAKAAAFVATLQAGYTDFHYLRSIWKENTEKDSLIGVGITGIASGTLNNLNLKEAAECVKAENKRVSKLIGINSAARTTLVKPSGTSSLLLGSSSGIHAYHDKYYIRRIRVGKTEPIYKYLHKKHKELIEDEFFKPHLQAVISIPQAAPENAVTRNESVFDLLERVKKFNIEWIANGHNKGSDKNNVSATISIKESEWEEVGNWLWDNRDSYTGISVLPYDGGTYVQAPFESINEEKYNELLSHLKEIDLTKIIEEEDETDLTGEVACAGGACEL